MNKQHSWDKNVTCSYLVSNYTNFSIAAFILVIGWELVGWQRWNNCRIIGDITAKYYLESMTQK